jgi:hypothetical protein
MATGTTRQLQESSPALAIAAGHCSLVVLDVQLVGPHRVPTAESGRDGYDSCDEQYPRNRRYPSRFARLSPRKKQPCAQLLQWAALESLKRIIMSHGEIIDELAPRALRQVADLPRVNQLTTAHCYDYNPFVPCTKVVTASPLRCLPTNCSRMQKRLMPCAGLATASSRDVLAGIVAGLASRGAPPIVASV